MSSRKTPEYRAKAAERMRRWRAENSEVHREREKARYWKNKAENPDALREKSRVAMAEWRKKNPERAKANQQRYYANNPEKVRATVVKYRYGITLEQWHTIFEQQGNRCAICGVTETRGWCVDHCHSTGRVRGILCHPCNTGIGFMEEDTERLSRAIDYLRSHHDHNQ